MCRRLVRVRALASGQLSGDCGLRVRLGRERPVAIDPEAAVAWPACRFRSALEPGGASVAGPGVPGPRRLLRVRLVARDGVPNRRLYLRGWLGWLVARGTLAE
jgi:hypothetical protein